MEIPAPSNMIINWQLKHAKERGEKVFIRKDTGYKEKHQAASSVTSWGIFIYF